MEKFVTIALSEPMERRSIVVFLKNQLGEAANVSAASTDEAVMGNIQNYRDQMHIVVLGTRHRGETDEGQEEIASAGKRNGATVILYTSHLDSFSQETRQNCETINSRVPLSLSALFRAIRRIFEQRERA